MIRKRRGGLLFGLSALAAVILLTSPAAAQTTADVPPFSIRVLGEATVTAEPDQVQIDVGVTTQADRAQHAAADNAQRTTRVVAELKRILEAEGTVRTVGYSVRPEYRYPREGGEPQIAGYAATNVVRVTTARLAEAGDLIDAAVKVGATRVHRVEYGLREDAAVYARALQEAARRARTEAGALASALDLRIVRVLSAVEQTTPNLVTDRFATAELAAQSVATPVHPAEIQVDAKLLLTVEVTAGKP